MTKGFLATLFAGVIAFGSVAPVFAAAPVISGLPDISVGDAEDSADAGSDTNVFQFSNAFKFSDYVTDSDTPVTDLRWSFGEFDSPAGLPTPEYSVNGKAPVNVGDTAIANDEAAGNTNAKNPGANQLNGSSVEYASFRDILFSPASGTPPFPDPSTTASAAAAQGKILRFYVADPDGNVAHDDIIVSSFDDGFDSATPSDGYDQIFTDSDFTSGWVKSGLDSGPEDAFDPTTPNDVDVTSATAGELGIIVRPSTAIGRYRILGWQNPTAATYDEVGPGKVLHAKFYVYTSNAASEPVNQVPGFRIRLENEGAVVAQTEFNLNQTDIGNVPYEPTYDLLNNPDAEARVAEFLRPSNQATKPSAYSVDFDPVDVPDAAGSTIWATLESYAFSGAVDATLSIAQVDVGTYRAKSDSEGSLIWSYDRSNINPDIRFTSGGFNAEADLQYGRRQSLDTTPGQIGAVTHDSDGIVVDTAACPVDVVGVGVVTLDYGTASARPRIQTDKLYRAKFYVTSDIPTTSNDSNATIQGGMRVYLQTGIGVVNTYLEITGAHNAVDQDNATKKIATEALPGTGSLNPDTSATLDTAGEAGGWYTVLLPSPLDTGGIRADNGDNFGAFGAEPGPGDSNDSAKDMVLGLDAIQQPNAIRVGPGDSGVLNPYAQPNRAKFRISKIDLYEYNAIDDGGYAY